MLGLLEDTDRIADDGENDMAGWKIKLDLLYQTKSTRMKKIFKEEEDDCGDYNSGNTPPAHLLNLRILYIPTAMYALRPDSTSTPGKQRGRNRADGKKRRTEIIRLLAGLFEQARLVNSSEDDADAEKGRCTLRGQEEPLLAIRTVTLDFDDGSIKQPELVTLGGGGIDTASGGNRDNKIVTKENAFPESGKDAIREWKPHLIYVQGGNTFWLQHCMEKGEWAQDIIDACCQSDDSSFSAVYCGVSAGAILAGESMQTACWKVCYNIFQLFGNYR